MSTTEIDKSQDTAKPYSVRNVLFKTAILFILANLIPALGIVAPLR